MRRYTPNVVNSVDQVGELFRDLRPGIAKRMRCGVCEQDVRYTHGSAVRWFLEHPCGDVPAPEVSAPRHFTEAPVPPRAARELCLCCGEPRGADHAYEHLAWFISHNGVAVAA